MIHPSLFLDNFSVFIGGYISFKYVIFNNYQLIGDYIIEVQSRLMNIVVMGRTR